MTKTQINILKRHMKRDKNSCIVNYGGKDVLVTDVLAVITLENIVKTLDIESEVPEVTLDKKDSERVSKLLDCVIQPCYTSELRIRYYAPDFIQYIKEISDTHFIFDFGSDYPAVQTKLLKDCISLIGEKKHYIEISFNPDKPLSRVMLIYSLDKPQTMCLLTPVRKGYKYEE